VVALSDTRREFPQAGLEPGPKSEADQSGAVNSGAELSPDGIGAGWTPQEVLAWAFAQYSPDIVLACSFGGASGMALLDMSVKLNPAVQVFYLDTGFLFPETYALVAESVRRYGIAPVAIQPLLTPQAQAARYGEALWRRDPDLCCRLRKVDPNRRALEGRRAWITGIRRDQTGSRRQSQVVEWDTQFGLVKVNPLAGWTEAQVWEYIRENQVPYNALHDRGYPSLGCTYCTRAVKPGEDLRAGRWSGTDKVECGLHLPGAAARAQDTPG
jgi:phosphoadenosine phosphosulfate reductase